MPISFVYAQRLAPLATLICAALACTPRARDAELNVAVETMLDAATNRADASSQPSDSLTMRFDGAIASEPPDAGVIGPGDWRQPLFDARGSGYNRDEKKLGRDNVHKLIVKWRFDDVAAGHAVGTVHATPAVLDGRVYVGSMNGRFYAIEPDGTMRWQYDTRVAKTPLSSPRGGLSFSTSPILGGAVLPESAPVAIFCDADGNLYALDRDSGRELWVNEDIDGHLLGGMIGNALTVVGDTVYVGFSSSEVFGLILDFVAGYPCCSFRGMVAAFDVRTGREKWRHYTIPPAQALDAVLAPYRRGPSGGAIWGPPTYDADSNTLFVGTGQNFSPAADGNGTRGTDSIIALNASTGAVKWEYQANSNDIWVGTRPNPDASGRYHDIDFGDSPKIYDLPGVGRVVGAGQKSGEYHVLRAATGELISRTQHVYMGMELGGFQNMGGYAEGVVYQHGVDRVGAPRENAPYVGTVMALSPDGRRVLWRFDRPQSPLAAGIATANGVVYVQSPVEEAANTAQHWGLYALDAKSGEVLHRMTFPGRTLASVVVSNGHVYVGRGNQAVPELGMDNSGGVYCLGLPD